MEIQLHTIVDRLRDAADFADGIEDAVFHLHESTGVSMTGVLALLRHHVRNLEEIHDFVTAQHNAAGGGTIVLLPARKAVRQ